MDYSKAVRDAQNEVNECYRKNTIKPDREKLVAFAQFLMQGISYPEITSAGAIEIVMQSKKKIDELSIWVFEQAHSL